MYAKELAIGKDFKKFSEAYLKMNKGWKDGG
jgi:hypothetical protein